MVNYPVGHRRQATAILTPELEETDAMRMLRSAYASRIMPDSLRWDTILAVLLWGGVTIFIFGIVVDLIH